MSQLVLLGGVVYALGSLLWANFLPGGIPQNALIPNLIALALGIVAFLFPYNLIFTCLF